MNTFTHAEVRRLEAELNYIPLRLRQAPLRRLIQFAPEIIPDQLYSFDTVFYRVTRFHPDSHGERLLAGGSLQRDLAVLIRRLSAQTPVAVDDDFGEVRDIESIAKYWRVSLRTVKRWSLDGLPLFCARFCDGRIAWATQAVALKRFQEARTRRRSQSTARLTRAERRAILERVAVLRNGGACADADIVRRVSRESGRSPATIRRIIRAARKVEEARTSKALPVAGMSERDAERLVTRYRAGVPVRGLAREFGLSSATIYRVLHHALVAGIVKMQIHYIPSAEFAAPEAEPQCLGDDGLFTFPPEPGEDMLDAPAGIPTYLGELYRIPLLTRAREGELFRKYNYIKYRMAMLQEQVRAQGYVTELVDRFDAFRRGADQVRQILIRCNLRLVVSVAKRHVGPLVKLMDLVSEGNMCLIRAVECYDYTRDARFATYATWALTKHFARVVPESNYHFNTFITGREEVFTLVGDERPDPQEQLEAVAHLRTILARAAGHLSERERVIIESHFGTNGRSPHTLEEIGKLFGLTRERIRQIERRALGKLRAVIGPEDLEAAT